MTRSSSEVSARATGWLSALSVLAGVALGIAVGIVSGTYLLSLPCIAAGVLLAAGVQSRREPDHAPPADTASEGPAAVVRRYLFDVIQGADPAPVQHLFSHSHRYSDPDGTPFRDGPEGMKEIAALVRGVIPEPRISVTRAVDDGDHLDLAFRVSGELHDGSREVSLGLRWRCHIVARQIVSTTGNVGLSSRLDPMLSADPGELLGDGLGTPSASTTKAHRGVGPDGRRRWSG